MHWKNLAKNSLKVVRLSMASLALFQFAIVGPLATPVSAHTPDQDRDGDGNTRTPIKHIIVIIGENRSFDHIFATYKAKHGQYVDNLLSKKIINADGTPGPYFSLAGQYSACDLGAGATCPNNGETSTSGQKYSIAPGGKKLFTNLPPEITGGPSNVCTDNGICTPEQAASSENGLPSDYSQYLLTGGTGLPSHVPDTRIQNVNSLPPGPFQLTSSTFPYDSYAASPVHRFYQMWQQEDCNASHASFFTPGGCLADLFPWVELTIGAGSNGTPPGSPAYNAPSGEGATSMGFYNVQEGDAPYLTQLANTYSMSDNYHQAVMGGTGANHIMLGTGDAMWFSDGDGNPEEPPQNVEVYKGTPNQGTVDEVTNPDPLAGTNNWYTEDGYGGGGYGSPVYGGGSYTECADKSQPGVATIVNYLNAIGINPNCQAGRYYLLNNYNPGYFGDGSNAYTDHNVDNTPFTIPPSNLRNIGDALLEKNISWRYYGDQWDSYAYGFPNANPPIPPDPYQIRYGAVGQGSDQYCNICNFFQYSSSIMTNAQVRTTHLKDTIDLYNDIQNGWLPAVAFVKPSGWVDGHPASSKLNLFEGFVKKIVDAVHSQPELWKDTAIFITVDEGGGYYDSGYVQALDYFGDGTRIPMIVVSPYSTGGNISHVYSDHVSILKFIEYNWKLKPLTNRSRDNYPNPKTAWYNPYVPLNSPAIGDLTDLFQFDHGDGDSR
jgi:phospholipase C